MIYDIENRRRQLKEDLIELSLVKYGLFNVDEWKKILATVITKKVDELDFSGENREVMRKKVSDLLYKVINDFESRYYEKNANSFSGMLKNLATSAFGAFDNIRRDVPKFTEQILDFMNDPRNKEALRNYIIGKLNEYASRTFSETDYSKQNFILEKHQVESREEAVVSLTNEIEKLTRRSAPFKVAVMVLALGLIAWVFVVRSFSWLQYTLFVVIAFLLLATGLLLPMIEIDARISRMTFTLLGESITFSDQVLYYKSKSILEVVWLMLRQSRVDVLIVGVLVLLFSVLFPVMKQVSSLLFVYEERLRANRVIRFMVFKTGKWSMADVMVIAIFMSYIGFSGIITEQLRQIESIATTLELLTTNQSSLLTGFFFFTAFALLSLAISQKLETQFKARPTDVV